MADDRSCVAELQNHREKLLWVEAILLGVLLLVTVIVTYQLATDAQEGRGSSHQEIVKVPGLLAAQSWPILNIVGGRSLPQEVSPFQTSGWVVPVQIFVANAEVNGWAEFKLPRQTAGRYRLQLYMTTAADYGIVKIDVNGKPTGGLLDLYGRAITPRGPIDVGLVELSDGEPTLRVTAVGHNPSNLPPYYQFGIQGATLTLE